MDFVKKKTAHDNLLGVTHLDADRKLLQKVAPSHKILSRGLFNPKQDAADTLWALLDFASAEEIIANRRQCVAQCDESDPAQTTAAAAELEAKEKAAAEAAASAELEAKEKAVAKMAAAEAKAKAAAEAKAVAGKKKASLRSKNIPK